MAASLEKALAKWIAKYPDRIRGAGCQGVKPLVYDWNADPVLQEIVPQQLLLRPIDDAASAEIAEHVNYGGA